MSYFLATIYDRFLEQASDEFKACIAADIPIEYTHEMKDGKVTLTGRTKVDVAVTRDPTTGGWIIYRKP